MLYEVITELLALEQLLVVVELKRVVEMWAVEGGRQQHDPGEPQGEPVV